MKSDGQRTEVLRLRGQGLTFAQIGHAFGFSRQRAFRIANPSRVMTAKRTFVFRTPDIELDKTLTIGQAAELLGISVSSLRRLSEKGGTEAVLAGQAA